MYDLLTAVYVYPAFDTMPLSDTGIIFFGKFYVKNTFFNSRDVC